MSNVFVLKHSHESNMLFNLSLITEHKSNALPRFFSFLEELS